MLTVERTQEFQDWFVKESKKSQRQIETRIANIQQHGHFGLAKNLGDGLAELKWGIGRRIYFTRIGKKLVLLLLGGNKHGQNKDIKAARKLIQEHL